MRIAKQLAGAEAMWFGSQFEAWIHGQHETAVNAGLVAWHRHISPKVRWVGKGPRGQRFGIVVGEACADYALQLVGGQSVVLEAKSVKEPHRLAICDFKKQQREHLTACARAGGLALMLAEFRSPNGQHKRFAVPWLEVPWRVRRTAQALDAIDLRGWEVEEPIYIRRFLQRETP